MSGRWGDDSDSDDDEVVILPSSNTLAQQVAAQQNEPEAETPRASNAPERNPWAGRGGSSSGGGRGRGNHSQERQNHGGGGRGQQNRQRQSHHRDSGRGGRNDNFSSSDWKAQAKRDSILNRDVDVAKEAGNWMATRRAKQQAAEEEQRKKSQQRNEAAKQEKEQQRKSQLQALKAAVSSIQKEKEEEVSSLQAAAPREKSQKRTILQRPVPEKPSTERSSTDGKGGKWERAPVRGGGGRHGDGRGGGRGGRRNQDHFRGGGRGGRGRGGRHGRSSLSDVAQPVGETAKIQTESGTTVEVRIEAPTSSGSSLQTRAEKLPNGGVKITRKSSAQQNKAIADDDITTTSNASGKSGDSGGGRGRGKKKKGRGGHDKWERAPRGGGRGPGRGGGNSGAGGRGRGGRSDRRNDDRRGGEKTEASESTKSSEGTNRSSLAVAASQAVGQGAVAQARRAIYARMEASKQPQTVGRLPLASDQSRSSSIPSRLLEIIGSPKPMRISSLAQEATGGKAVSSAASEDGTEAVRTAPKNEGPASFPVFECSTDGQRRELGQPITSGPPPDIPLDQSPELLQKATAPAAPPVMQHNDSSSNLTVGSLAARRETILSAAPHKSPGFERSLSGRSLAAVITRTERRSDQRSDVDHTMDPQTPPPPLTRSQSNSSRRTIKERMKAFSGSSPSSFRATMSHRGYAVNSALLTTEADPVLEHGSPDRGLDDPRIKRTYSNRTPKVPADVPERPAAGQSQSEGERKVAECLQILREGGMRASLTEAKPIIPYPATESDGVEYTRSPLFAKDSESLLSEGQPESSDLHATAREFVPGQPLYPGISKPLVSGNDVQRMPTSQTASAPLPQASWSSRHTATANDFLKSKPSSSSNGTATGKRPSSLAMAAASQSSTARPSSLQTSAKSDAELFKDRILVDATRGNKGCPPTNGLSFPKESSKGTPVYPSLPVLSTSAPVNKGSALCDSISSSQSDFVPGVVSNRTEATKSRISMVAATNGAARPKKGISSLALAASREDGSSYSVPNKRRPPKISVPIADLTGTATKPPLSPPSLPPRSPQSKRVTLPPRVDQNGEQSKLDAEGRPLTVYETYMASQGQPPPPPQYPKRKKRGPAARAPYKGKRVLNRPARAHASRIEIG